MKRLRTKCPAGIMSAATSEQHPQANVQQNEHQSQRHGQLNQPLMSQLTTSQPQPTYPIRSQLNRTPPQLSNPLHSKPSLFDQSMENATAADTSKPKKKGSRGISKCLWLIKLEPGVRLDVKFNKKNKPIGDNARKFTSYHGLLARDGQLAPINYANWRGLPETYNDYLWKLALLVFNLKVEPIHGRYFVMESLGKKWKDYKHRIKKHYYDIYSTDEEALKDCPTTADPAQWKDIIAFWSSETGKARIAASKNNSNKMTSTHIAGSKSFVRMYEEEKEKNDRNEPSLAQMFIKTRTRKNRLFVNEKALNIIEQLKELLSQQSKEVERDTAENDILSQVLGENSCGSCLVLGKDLKIVLVLQRYLRLRRLQD